MRSVLAAMLIAFAPPAFAADCEYISGFDYGSARFVDDDTVILETYFQTDGPESCGYDIGDESANTITCASGFTEQFSFASPTLGGEDSEALLILLDHVWYRRCYEPA